MRTPLTREDYYGKSIRPLTTAYAPPFVHPDDCDFERGDEINALCSRCCPCDLCGEDRALTAQQAATLERTP